MSLNKAHEGYEYQDLLTCYFILKEVLDENDSSFIIDRKQHKGDKMDDLIISNNNGVFKKQIKYSNLDTNHTLSKSDLSSDSNYRISLDTLFESWNGQPQKETTEFRIYLAWNEPEDELKSILQPVQNLQTFESFATGVFKINPYALWPEGSEPLSSWQRFRKASLKIDKKLFVQFCDQLIFEVLMPKLSLDVHNPGDLEKQVILQAKHLGIGTFPNDSRDLPTFILSLLAIVKRARSQDLIITTTGIFHELNIRTDYGSIEQNFPVVKSENLTRKEAMDNFISETKNLNKVILVGEPGSGKSWLIENLRTALQKDNIKVIRHYCYTNIDDILQRERIKLNVFYGNLIADIVKSFPELKKYKEEKFASSLKELNNLLERIAEPAYLIVDGLDHIDRIFSSRAYVDIPKQDVAIIESISKIKISDKVKIIVVSQNISQLDEITGFTKINIPSWNRADVVKFVNKRSLKEIKSSKEFDFINLLLEKSAGNPLYLKYLIDELKNSTSADYAEIENLPPYSFNLAGYYDYLLRQLDTKQDVPRILSGINFSLTRSEIEEITGSGDYVADALKILSPILKINLSQSGYIIYHESFRRFIIEHLKSKSVSIERNVFEPVINWLSKKDFFIYKKSYRYNLQLLFEAGRFSEMLTYLKYTFVTDSLFYGSPWDLIIKNYKYFVKAACCSGDLPMIVLLNELDKVLANNQDNLTSMFQLYLNTLGKIHGFNFVSEYLAFEGSRTLNYEDGLKACYACDENGMAAPWDLYMKFFDLEKTVKPDQFKYFIRGHLVLKNEKKLNTVSKKLKNKRNQPFVAEFRNELSTYSNKGFITHLSNSYPGIKSILEVPTHFNQVSPEQLIETANQLLIINYISTDQREIIELFFEQVNSYAADTQLLNIVSDIFKGKNWFYNWIIYFVKVTELVNQTNPTSIQIKEAFDYLIHNTEPFLGEPRVSDLYPIHSLIYQSYLKGLSLIKTDGEWKDAIETLVKLSDETTVSIQRSITGPLSTDVLFKLFSEVLCQQNMAYINEAVQKLANEKQEYHLHSYIAEYYMRLASFYHAANNLESATTAFRKGMEFIQAYPMHKDMTLSDAIQGVEYISSLDTQQGLVDLERIEVLIESAIAHTDGKETRYFPIDWFERFIKIYFTKAELYLLNESSQSKFNWRAEKYLQLLLSSAKGQINPVVEFFLVLTFPTDDSEHFMATCLHLSSILKNPYPEFFEKLVARIVPSMQPKQNRSHTASTIVKYNEIISNESMDPRFKVPEKQDSDSFIPSPSDKNRNDSVDYNTMTIAELTSYLESNGIETGDIPHLAKRIIEWVSLDDSVKEFIRTVAKKNSRSYSKTVNIDSLFECNNAINCFYWTCRYVYDLGDWFERLVNVAAFQRAYELDPNQAFNHLFELLPASLDIGFNYVFSANLIKTLTTIGYDRDVITRMWKNVLETTSYRLPVQEQIDWEPILSDDLNMDNEEILICILICRFKAGTTERIQWITTALKYLIDQQPRQLIKPLKWFFQNSTKFFKSTLAIILQLLYEKRNNDSSYHINFETELKRLAPQRYFIVDYIINKLFKTSMSAIDVPEGLTYPAIPDGHYQYLLTRKVKYMSMEQMGLNMDLIFNKHVAGFKEKYGDYWELYWNNLYKIMTPNIQIPEDILELINVDLYNELIAWSKVEKESVFQHINFIDIDAIAAQANSYGLRPVSLTKPFDLEKELSRENIVDESEWIRLGHCEYAFKEGHGLKCQPYKSFGGVIFSNTFPKGVPYAGYRIFPSYLWQDFEFDYEIEETVVFAILQEDPLEYYNFIWLNPSIVKLLELSVKNASHGLVAVNKSNEVILKMNTWSTDYFGDSYPVVLNQQIPRLKGTELLIRNDYFKKICLYFKTAPAYYTCKAGQVG